VAGAGSRARAGGRRGPGTRVEVRRAHRSADDGYRSALAPGLRASADAERLTAEIAFAAGRLERLSEDPPGLFSEVAREADVEEALWLAFLIAYIGPLEDDEPFAAIAAARTSWSSGGLPSLDDVATGPRSAHEPGRGPATLLAYRAWAERAGSQAVALTGESHWPPERRFARTFERLALPGLNRAARFDLLTTLGALGPCELKAASLFLGDDETTLGAKRLLGIGDPLLLDRRALALAEACEVPLAALDLALFNWHRGDRVTLGVHVPAESLESTGAQQALGL
jgi:hypothetical protein